jgi:plastocyanin
MSDATVFYILGGALAAIAVLTSFAGLRFRSFPGRFAPIVFLCFLILAGTAITFAVRNGQHEEKARAAENKAAGEEIEEAEENPAVGHEEGENAGPGTTEAKEEPGQGAAGKGSTVRLEAAETAIAYEQNSLTATAGNVTIDFTNPSALEHDVAIEGAGGEEIAVSKVIAESSTSVSAELKPGKYTFFCTVPGHREAGMEGTLTVK